MVNRYSLVLLALCSLSGCSGSQINPEGPTDTSLSTAQQALLTGMLDCIAHHDTLAPDQVRRRLAALEEQPLVASNLDRFRLACLLSRKSASDAELTRAQQLLEELAKKPDFNAPKNRQVLTLYRHNLALTQQLRQQRHATSEYRHKIEQLKGLEDELDPANATKGTAP